MSKPILQFSLLLRSKRTKAPCVPAFLEILLQGPVRRLSGTAKRSIGPPTLKWQKTVWLSACFFGGVVGDQTEVPPSKHPRTYDNCLASSSPSEKTCQCVLSALLEPSPTMEGSTPYSQHCSGSLGRGALPRPEIMASYHGLHMFSHPQDGQYTKSGSRSSTWSCLTSGPTTLIARFIIPGKGTCNTLKFTHWPHLTGKLYKWSLYLKWDLRWDEAVSLLNP